MNDTKPTRRRTLSGKLVPILARRESAVRTQYVRQPGPGAQRAAVLFSDVPEPMRVVLTDIPGPVPGQPRRRDRRAAARKGPRS